MYPRHRPDIQIGDLAFGLAACVWARDPNRFAAELERNLSPPTDAVVCLSVRSGFDLLLEALDLPPESEALVSAVTHPDMIGILELHGLRPIPVDLDLRTLDPRRDLLAEAVTGRTRMILVAHLFGASSDLEPSAEIARRHGLLLVEDCAQNLGNAQLRGDELADVSLFSFGPIKTSTALGGAVLRVKDPALEERIRTRLRALPLQPRREFAGRAAKFSFLQVLARPALFGMFARLCRAFGRDLDELLSTFVRGFSVPYSDPAFAARIRRRPSAPLLALLRRRLRRFDTSRIERRTRIGEQLARSLTGTAFSPGQDAVRRSHWVLPVVCRQPELLLAGLRSRGFDAAPSDATSAITVVAPPADRPELRAMDAESMMSRITFVPCYPQLPDRAVRRMIAAIEELVGGQVAVAAPVSARTVARAAGTSAARAGSPARGRPASTRP